jgi:hypothetical protein
VSGSGVREGKWSDDLLRCSLLIIDKKRRIDRKRISELVLSPLSQGARPLLLPGSEPVQIEPLEC